MIPSPCIGLCRIDETSNLCLGCARTRHEIAGWRSVSPDARQMVWDALRARRVRLGLGVHRLPWTAEDLQRFVRGTLRAGGGTWVGGIVGAVAEFCVGEGEVVMVETAGDQIEARTKRGAMRLALGERVRALAFGDDVEGPVITVLALVREDVREEPETVFTRVGLDHCAMRREDRDGVLYDFGFGRAAGRFGVRTADPGLKAVLETCLGRPWTSVLAACGGALLAASPPRVVRNPIGRIEVFTPIPPPGGRSPEGPHTHVLPDHLARGGDCPLPVPEAYVPCAIHYPDPSAAALDTGGAGTHA